jgi:hypothetical protein
MKDPKVFGTEYDIIMLCEFLQVSIKVFSPSLFFEENGLIQCYKNLSFMEISHRILFSYGFVMNTMNLDITLCSNKFVSMFFIITLNCCYISISIKCPAN